MDLHYLIVFSVEFPLPISKVNGSVAIGVEFLNTSIWEYTLLLPTGVDVFGSAIWEDDLLGAIRVVLLTLGATQCGVSLLMKCCQSLKSLHGTYLGNSNTSSPSG